MPSLQTDPFLFDMDRLHSIASERIVKRGIAYENEHRVTELNFDDERISALVEGSIPDEPYFVEIMKDHDDHVVTNCSCAFNWEPICKHAVAVLLAYGQQQTQLHTEVESATDSAIAMRAKRGRTEVRVTHVTGKPWFGTWCAQSVTSHTARRYEIQIRSLDKKQNNCSCPDYAINYLGTCKHIEAVLHRLKKSDLAESSDPPLPFVYLSWGEPDPPVIKLQHSRKTDEDLNQIIARYFDVSGRFTGQVPDDFFRFHNEIRGNSHILIGEDAIAYSTRLLLDTQHQQKAHRIKEQIIATGGYLKGMLARLYPYQVEGVAFLASNGRALLADDMGLGKTIQAIAAATWLKLNQNVSRTLIVCPASLKAQWAREIQKFTGQSVEIVGGNAAARIQQYKRRAAFTIANYELMLRDVTVINRLLGADLMVIDEAQRIKNWRTKTAGAMRMIETRYLFVLTGTPLENRLEDLYSLVQLVDPQLLGPLWRFFLEFHITNDRGRVLGYRNLSELRRRLEPIMLRRSRSLVKDQLPERTQQRLDIAMTARQTELHNGALSTASMIAVKAKKRPLTPSENKRFMAALQMARMACNGAFLVDNETRESPKLDELARLLEDICLEDGLKVVIFSQWQRMTARVEELARKMRIGAVHLHGGVPTKNRGKLMDQFRENPETQLFISTDAGGVGLNLQSASVLINLDMPWNPAILEQRIARVHRLGQKEKVQVILMVASDSYEERICQMVQDKRELFDNVIAQESDEDVVGVSRKAMEALLKSLDRPPQISEDLPPSGDSELADLTLTPDPNKNKKTKINDAQPAKPSLDDLKIRAAVEALQKILGLRLERILVEKGGLMVITTQVDEAFDALVAEIESPVPIAVIDTRTYNQLKRLKAYAHLDDSQTVYEKTVTQDHALAMITLAKQKFRSAEALLSQDITTDGLTALAQAMLAAFAARIGLESPLAIDKATLWMYSEALPKGLITKEEAATVTKTLSLVPAQGIPVALLSGLKWDANAIITASRPN